MGWNLVLYGVAAVAAVFAAWLLLQGIWRGLGLYRIWMAGPRRLLAFHHTIWREPSALPDAEHGPGSAALAPLAPFRFIEEHASGSQPCVSVRDARGRRWRVKWGGEVQSETFAVRVAWACGYFAEVTYFVASGRIGGASDLRRAKACIADDGSFCDARFELDDPAVRKLFEEHSWAWDDNPFNGTPQLSGLKIIVMLLSNWDTKDRRDVARGSNTAIFETRVSRWHREAQYLLTDWGGSMGTWGSNVATRGRWDAAGFESQTPQFVTGVSDGYVQFGYAGQRTADVARDITVEHVRWLLPHLARLDEDFFRTALRVSGATDEEEPQFTRALLARIEALRRAVDAVHAPAETRKAS